MFSAHLPFSEFVTLKIKVFNLIGSLCISFVKVGPVYLDLEQIVRCLLLQHTSSSIFVVDTPQSLLQLLLSTDKSLHIAHFFGLRLGFSGSTRWRATYLGKVKLFVLSTEVDRPNAARHIY